jgi:predicted O-methyltransferase YrrM
MAVYDCFSFFNELDLLELRLRELEDVVDWFVLAEAPVTHAGQAKPLYFAENKRAFRPWLDKIRHVVVEDMPMGPDPWLRENHQRNALARGLAGAGPTDGIIISDCDEIPSADAVRRWPGDSRMLAQMFAYYWINCLGGGWSGSRILPYAEFTRHPNATAIRLTEFPLLERGGWHVSFAGGPDRIVQKLEAYAHQDVNQDRFKARDHLTRVSAAGADLFGRAGHQWHFEPLDQRFPAALLEDRIRFAHLVCEALFHEDWYPDVQLERLVSAFARVRYVAGAVMEIGCWEGKSTIALANACYPDILDAVDTWAGSADEDPQHPTVLIAAQRDVYAQFLKNVKALTRGNIRPVRNDCHNVLSTWSQPLKFVHVDASQDYRSVWRTLLACVPLLVPGGVLCGDDFETADLTRTDLDGGVERAVREVLPAFERQHNFWLWQKPEA